MVKYILSCLFLFCCIIGCQRDIDIFVPDNNNIGQVLNPSPVRASVTGQVIDENNDPVVGATVRCGPGSTITDIRGQFRLNNVTIDKYASVVTVNHNGYFKGIRTFSAAEGSVNFIKIKLLPKQLSGTFDAVSGGSATLTNNSTLSLGANAVVFASNGQAYTGTVRAFTYNIDPTNPDIVVAIPGSLQALDQNNFRGILKSYGMMAVQLESPAGELLQIAPGKTASLKFVIPASLTATAPSSIPLWSLDETTGLWKEEGRATKTGDQYEGTVSHFSFWNCDVLSNAIFLDMDIKDGTDPLAYTLVRITRVNNPNSSSMGYTDSTGHVGGFVFSNETFLLEVLNDCMEPIHSQQIGPFSANTNIGVINVTVPQQLSLAVSGTAVDCNNNPVANGIANIYWQGRNFTTQITNGSFSNTALSRCTSGPSNVEIVLVDYSTYSSSAVYSGNSASGAINTGAITICGSVSSQQFVELHVDSSDYLFVPPGDTLMYYSQGTLNIGIQASSLSNFSGVNFSFDPVNPGPIGAGSAQNLLNFTSTYINQGVSYLGGPTLVNITEYGSVGEYIAGNFSGTAISSLTAPFVTYTISCSFRIRRTF